MMATTIDIAPLYGPHESEDGNWTPAGSTAYAPTSTVEIVRDHHMFRVAQVDVFGDGDVWVRLDSTTDETDEGIAWTTMRSLRNDR